ncbi:MAG: acyltransferase [Sterolibacteriaceae bacterium]|nr:acyltransferase [Sterolibacteriaceae bacterium]MBK9084586.1 acyltransferase [Sterolibacteriaceae bacterium]
MLRGPAALFVAWDHLVAIYLDQRQMTSELLQEVRRWVNGPFGLTQDFGWFGVCLFFLISGFVITHVSQRENPAEFAVKRLFRIFPALAVSVLLLGLLGNMLGLRHLSVGEIALATTLLNYFQVPQVVVNGAAWTLVVEVLFYLLTLTGMRLVSRPILWVSTELVVIAFVILTAREFGDRYFLFAATAAYVPYLIVGQLIYYAMWQRSLSPPLFLLFMLANTGVMLTGLMQIHPRFLSSAESYIPSVVMAVVVFLVTMQFNSRLRPNAISARLANYSYSIYLYHGILGTVVLDASVKLVGYLPALALAVMTIFVVCATSFRFVEQPSQAFARRIWRGSGRIPGIP